MACISIMYTINVRSTYEQSINYVFGIAQVQPVYRVECNQIQGNSGEIVL